MSIRKALKADFGIDVLIERGVGLQSDPYVLEACSAADATRTQLNLLRGLGRGRGELWRLINVETGVGSAADLQKLRIESVRFTQQEIITETRAYYFDVSMVGGMPDAANPGAAWSDSRSRFSAEQQIGWLHFDRAIDNSGDSDRLDTSLQYSALLSKAAIYVYGSPDRSPSELSSADQRLAELHLVCEGVRLQHPGAEMVGAVVLAEPFVLQHFLIGDDMSVAGIADMGEHYLKLRLTYHDEPKMRELMSYTVSELSRLAMSAS
jgi:hypothetical protein